MASAFLDWGSLKPEDLPSAFFLPGVAVRHAPCGLGSSWDARPPHIQNTFRVSYASVSSLPRHR